MCAACSVLLIDRIMQRRAEKNGPMFEAPHHWNFKGRPVSSYRRMHSVHTGHNAKKPSDVASDVELTVKEDDRKCWWNFTHLERRLEDVSRSGEGDRSQAGRQAGRQVQSEGEIQPVCRASADEKNLSPCRFRLSI